MPHVRSIRYFPVVDAAGSEIHESLGIPALTQRFAHALSLPKKFMRILATGIGYAGGVNADIRSAFV
jgi:hypothetical protein